MLSWPSVAAKPISTELAHVISIFHLANSLVVLRNLWLILFSRIGLFSDLVKHTSTIF
jgi:hypothetical protein